jgi:hypothetical protein
MDGIGSRGGNPLPRKTLPQLPRFGMNVDSVGETVRHYDHF